MYRDSGKSGFREVEVLDEGDSRDVVCPGR